MSEEQLEVEEVEQIEAEADPVEKEPESEKVEDPEAAYREREKERASGRGWTDYDTWVENGNDPEEWVPAEIFNERGKYYNQVKNMKKEFDERLHNVNQMHAAQLETQRQELMEKRDTLIEEGGKENLAKIKNLDHQIKELDKVQPAPQQQEVDPVLVAWDEKNNWIQDKNDPRRPFALMKFNEGKANGMNSQAIVDMIDRELARAFPSPTKKPAAPVAEKGKNRGFSSKRVSKEITVADLTPEEKHSIRNSSYLSSLPEDKLLQLVKDSRTE